MQSCVFQTLWSILFIWWTKQNRHPNEPRWGLAKNPGGYEQIQVAGQWGRHMDPWCLNWSLWEGFYFWCEVKVSPFGGQWFHGWRLKSPIRWFIFFFCEQKLMAHGGGFEFLSIQSLWGLFLMKQSKRLPEFRRNCYKTLGFIRCRKICMVSSLSQVS